MRRAYVLIYNDKLGTREEIRDFLDGRSDILHWRYDLPYAFYLISESSAEELYEVVQGFNRERGRFLITEVGANIQGWLPKETWTLLNSRHSHHTSGRSVPH